MLSSPADSLAPGGWLLIEDFDWAIAAIIDPPSPIHDRVTVACREFMRSRGYDPEHGRRLPRSLAAAGLVDVGTHAVAVQVQANPELGVPPWKLRVEQLAPGLLADGSLAPADPESFTALCLTPATRCSSHH